MALWTRRQETPPQAAITRQTDPRTDPSVHAFRAWTESLIVTGRIRSSDRLSDALNKREHVRVESPTVVPIGAGPDARYQALEMVIDPCDLEGVLAPADERGPQERGARRIHKVRYPVIIEAGPFEVHGTIHIFPGNAPEFVSQHSGALFFPITNAVVRRGGRNVTGPSADVILVSRYTIKRITQVDSVH